MNDNLEAYKEIWIKNIDQISKDKKVNTESLKLLIKNKGNNSIRFIKKNFLKEFVISILILIGVSYLLFVNFEHNISIIIFGCTVIPISILYLIYARNFSGLIITNDDLKYSISYNINRIKKSIQFYYKSLIYGFPILYFLALLLQKLSEENFLDFTTNQYIIIGIGVLFSILIPKPSKFLIDRMYTKHLNDLEKSLKELEEN